MRVVVLGANGQVGAEVCLHLARESTVQLLPVCRNRLGSAFLRSRGIACRHGRPADAGEAAGLVGDADLVATFALAAGLPRAARDADAAIVEHAIALSPPRARVVFFSTLAVIESNGAYAHGKQRCERLALALGRKHGKEVFVLRLGHVTGELQNISHLLREATLHGAIAIPDAARASNTTHVATIAEAIVRIARGEEAAGVYHLVNVPQWSWRQVIEHEAALAGAPARIESVPAAHSPSERSRRRALRNAVARIAGGASVLKERGMRLAARLSPEVNLRLQAMSSTARAAREVAALTPAPALVTDAVSWPEITGPLLRTLTPTADLLAVRGEIARIPLGRAWPADAPLAPSRSQRTACAAAEHEPA